MRKSSPPSPFRRKRPDRVTLSLGYPALLHWGMLVVLLGLLVFSAFQQMVPLLATTTFLLVLAVLSRMWSRYALRSVSARISSSQGRVFPGEQVELTFEVDNKGLPLPWLEAEMELPYRLATGKRSISPYSKKRLRWVSVLSPGQAVTWKHTLEAKARGDYRLGPLRLRSGDMLGLFPRELVLPQFESLLVYPRIFPLEKLNLPLRALLGEKVTQRSIYEDTSRVSGARDYQMDDPFKRIHWKASAAHGNLQSRQYESSTSLSLLLVLDVHSFPEEDEEFERAVSTTASLAYEAQRQGFALGLITNSEPEIDIPLGSGRSQLLLILEALARITAKSRTSLAEQMDRRRTRLPLGATLVVVTRSRTPILNGLGRQLERKGHSLLWVSMQETAEPSNPVITSPGGEAHP
ncbi:MAG: DUF58 domain-containing protein [Chloroflexota bacterium]